MKKKILIISIAFIFNSQIVSAQVPTYVPTENLLGYWPFSGNANDTSGNSRNGTVTGAVLSSDRFGNSNKAYAFNGTSFIEILNSTSQDFSLNDFTISAWINYNSPIYDGCIAILSKGISSLVVFQNGLGFDSYGKCYEANSNSSLVAGNWFHVVCVKNKSGYVYYINNSPLVRSFNTFNTPKSDLTNNLKIGGAGAINYNSYLFNGAIDDVGLWSRALSKEEITNLYYAESNTCQSLVINTGILSYNPISYNSTVTIFPNPANDQITIDCGDLTNVKGYQIKIFNELGQEVFTGAMNTKQYNISLNTWTGKGLYLVRIYDASNNEVNVKKIILK